MVKSLIILLAGFFISYLGICLGRLVHRKDQEIFKLLSVLIFFPSVATLLYGILNFLNAELHFGMSRGFLTLFIITIGLILSVCIKRSCDISYQERGWDYLDKIK